MTLDRNESKEFFQKHSTYIKLGDGDKMVGTFKGKTYARFVIWIGGRTEPYDSTKHAGLRTPDGKPNRPSKKESANFLVQADDGSWTAKIFDSSERFFNQFAGRQAKFGDGKLWEIERKGEKQKTRYEIDPVGDLSADDLAAIAAVDLHDLQTMFGEQAEAVNENNEAPEDPPF